MIFDRGFIKWQPFNSVAPSKIILNNALEHKVSKPELFPEELEIINNKIIEAYYSKNEIEITYYEENTIKKIKTKICKIDTTSNIIYLNNKIITFNQIINVK